MMQKLSCLIWAILLMGCVSIKLNGFIDPAYQKYDVGKVIVRIKGTSMEETFAAEEKISEMLAAHNIPTVKYSTIIPPTRANQSSEAEMLIKSGCDSVFSIYISKNSVQDYVPPTYISGKYGHTTGGHYTIELIMATLVTIINLHTGNEVYRAEGYSGGGSTYLELLMSTVKSAVDDLVQKGLISK